MPDLLQKLRENGCQVTFIESERISKSTSPTVLEELMPSQVDRLKAGNVPEWYNANDIDDGSGLKSLDGLSTALAQLRSFISAQESAFDIVMGHSQGAQLTAILTLMMESEPDWLPAKRQWKGIVCLNAPNPFDKECTLVERVKKHGQLATPSLHVYGGEKDFTYTGSKEMRSTHFRESKVWELTHEEGHFPPKDAKTCEKLVDMIRVMLESSGNSS